jgi:hypothetical protein
VQKGATAAFTALVEAMMVGPGGICFFFCPNSLCIIPQNRPIMLGLCPTTPIGFQKTRR